MLSLSNREGICRPVENFKAKSYNIIYEKNNRRRIAEMPKQYGKNEVLQMCEDAMKALLCDKKPGR